MNFLAKTIHWKALMKDFLARVLLILPEEQKEAKQDGRTKDLEGVYQLTPRQIQIAKLLLDGYSNAEIANELYIAVSTVRSHVRRIYFILGAKGRRDIRKRISDDDAKLIRSGLSLYRRIV
jgi:DNA-binding CsgD family transcriptional regulator